MSNNAYVKWKALAEDADLRRDFTDLYPGKYLLMCVHTNRFGVGDPGDGQGGYLSASLHFDQAHGTMEESGETFRDLIGMVLTAKT